MRLFPWRSFPEPPARCTHAAWCTRAWCWAPRGLAWGGEALPDGVVAAGHGAWGPSLHIQPTPAGPASTLLVAGRVSARIAYLLQIRRGVTAHCSCCFVPRDAEHFRVQSRGGQEHLRWGLGSAAPLHLAPRRVLQLAGGTRAPRGAGGHKQGQTPTDCVGTRWSTWRGLVTAAVSAMYF